jgi:hypothetical protein
MNRITAETAVKIKTRTLTIITEIKRTTITLRT